MSRRLRILAGITSAILAALLAFVSVASWWSICEMRKGKVISEPPSKRSDVPVKYEPFGHVDFVFVCVGETFLEGSTFSLLLGATSAVFGGLSAYLLRRQRR